MPQIPIYEKTEIEKVINFMKAEKTILDITENSGIYTIFSDSLVLLRDIEITYLKAGQIVTIDNINYPVLSVNLSLKSFTITKDVALFHMTTDVIPEKVLDVIKWTIACNFLRGSRIEINQRLKSASDDPEQKMTRFPLIWMFINNKRTRNPAQNIYFKSTIEFAIVNLTEKTYTTDKRDEFNFNPIMYPLFDLFKRTIESCYFSKVFFFENRKNYEFGEWFRYFYGSADKNAQVFDAPTDAIEISLDLNFLEQFT